MNPAPGPPPHPEGASTKPAGLPAWPSLAQLALAFLLGMVVTLLAVHAHSSLRWGSKPTEVERDRLQAYQIDLNQAGRAELLQIPGVGEGMAGRIEDYRREHGGFGRAAELQEVKGVGRATVNRVQSWVRASPDKDEPFVEPPEKMASSRKPGGVKSAGKKGTLPKGRNDLNQASLEELQLLPGIGPKMAERIVAERRKRPFRSVDELRRVSGIGPKRLETLRPLVTVEEEPGPVAAAESPAGR